MTSILRILTSVSLLGGALAVGACGDDDSDDGSSSTGGAVNATGGNFRLKSGSPAANYGAYALS